MIEQELEFLRELVVVIDRVRCQHVEDRCRRAVEVDTLAMGLAIPPGRHGLEGEVIIDGPLTGQRDALVDHFIGFVDARPAVIDIVGHREGAGGHIDPEGRREGWRAERGGDGEFAMPGIGIAVIVQPVGREAEEPVRRRFELDGEARGKAFPVPDIGTVPQIGAIAVTPVDPQRTTHAQPVSQRCGARDDQVALIVFAQIGPHGEGRLIVQPRGNELDRPADRVAAIERALRTAQNLDPLDIENIQDRPLRPGDIDIVDIETDPRLEPPQRILLADAADESCQRGIRRPRDLKRQIGRVALERRDVRRAGQIERFGALYRHRDGYIDQAFLAASGRDDDGIDGALTFAGRRALLGGCRRARQQSCHCCTRHQIGPQARAGPLVHALLPRRIFALAGASAPDRETYSIYLFIGQ